MTAPSIAQQCAHQYVDRGLEVLLATGKRLLPACAGWQDTGGITSRADLDRLFVVHPDANVAIPAARNGLVILDLDEGWQPAIRELESELGPLDWSALAITGSGNAAAYFAVPREIATTIPNRATALWYGVVTPGVGTRTNGYQIAPGSVHPDTGAHYEWAPHGFTMPAAFPALPQAWIDALTYQPPRVAAVQPRPVSGRPRDARTMAAKAMATTLARLAAAPDGTHHDALFRAARFLGGFLDLDDHELRGGLENVCAGWGKLDRGARQTINDGLRAGRSAPHARAA